MEIRPIRNLLRSASAQSLNFLGGEISTFKANRTDRERTKYIEIDRATGYDGCEATRRPLSVPPKTYLGNPGLEHSSHLFLQKVVPLINACEQIERAVAQLCWKPAALAGVLAMDASKTQLIAVTLNTI